MDVRAERAKYENQEIIKLLFDYNKEIIAKILLSTQNIKHKAMLSLIYSCGLRRSELLNMQITDIDSKRNVITIRHAKGDKDRIVPLSEKILILLREYFKQYRPKKWLFEGQIAGTQYTNNVFQNTKRKAGIEMPCTLHSFKTLLRDTFIRSRNLYKIHPSFAWT